MLLRRKRRILKGKLKEIYYSLILRNKIKKYHKEISKNKPSKIIYTCSTGKDYDSININEFLDPEYEYVFFTDNQDLIKRKTVGPWKIRPLIFDNMGNHKNNRYHKFFPNLLFPEYQESIYIDANIVVLTSKLFESAEALSHTSVILSIPQHRRRSCIYDEIDLCLRTEKDKKERLEKHREFLLKEGYPKQNGLTENNVIYRKHNDPSCIKIMQQWWEMLENYSQRDQLSLFYILWKNSIEMTYLTDMAIKDDKENFQINHHNV
ncbi:MAG: glycosyltransferase domain-containing protein [Alphaproteobacteria bacterium]